MMTKMSPKFLRFPGGNYVEGNDFHNRFDWKRTVGSPDERPATGVHGVTGRPTDWACRSF